jgi:hypothetical protein
MRESSAEKVLTVGTGLWNEENDALIFLRVLQWYELTYDSTKDPRIIERPDTVFCEYEVDVDYKFKPYTTKVVNVTTVYASYMNITYDNANGLYINPTGQYRDNLTVNTTYSIKWPEFLQMSAKRIGIRTMLGDIFGRRFIRLGSLYSALELSRSDSSPEVPSYLTYTLRKNHAPNPEISGYVDPFEQYGKAE